MIKLFWVTSRDLQSSVYARTVEEAAQIAIERELPKELGFLMHVREYQPKREDWYIHTEMFLKKIGKWSEKKTAS